MRTENLSFRRELRRDATEAERVMWRLLRDRRLANAKFRRQHPIGPYTVDFFCAEHGLAIELDGGQHYSGSGLHHDTARTAYLEGLGITVLRFTNFDVFHGGRSVLEALWQALERRSLLSGR